MQRGTVLDLHVAGEVLSRCVHESNETKIEVRNHLDFTLTLSLSLCRLMELPTYPKERLT
jgi:hypothetical protein